MSLSYTGKEGEDKRNSQGRHPRCVQVTPFAIPSANDCFSLHLGAVCAI